MIAAIATDKPDSSSRLSRRGPRAGFFLVFDDNGRLFKRITNPYQRAKSNILGAVSSLLMEHDVELVVANGFGQKFRNILEAHGIRGGDQKGDVKSVRDEIYESILKKNSKPPKKSFYL
jgi:predicted Fe-Mo cluster-binding NifX family protein